MVKKFREVVSLGNRVGSVSKAEFSLHVWDLGGVFIESSVKEIDKLSKIEYLRVHL